MEKEEVDYVQWLYLCPCWYIAWLQLTAGCNDSRLMTRAWLNLRKTENVLVAVSPAMGAAVKVLSTYLTSMCHTRGIIKLRFYRGTIPIGIIVQVG